MACPTPPSAMLMASSACRPAPRFFMYRSGSKGHVRLARCQPPEVAVALVGDGLIVGLILRRMRRRALPGLLGVGSLAEPELLVLPVACVLGLLA
jgi:hypothetical protein